MGHTYDDDVDDDDDQDEASFSTIPFFIFLLELLWHDGYSLGVNTSLTLIPTMATPCNLLLLHPQTERPLLPHLTSVVLLPLAVVCTVHL